MKIKCAQNQYSRGLPVVAAGSRPGGSLAGPETITGWSAGIRPVKKWTYRCFRYALKWIHGEMVFDWSFLKKVLFHQPLLLRMVAAGFFAIS